MTALLNTTAELDTPYLLARATVLDVARVSPNFIRIRFGGEELGEIGTLGDVADVRIKLVFPPDSGVLPEIDRAGDWWEAFLAVPEAERGSIRTYSIRELIVSERGTEIVVDFVRHLAPGLSGPASRWAAAARTGDEVYLVGPRRGHADRPGIEYAPGGAAEVVLVGDETAAPAIARILEDAPAQLRGAAFIEVPEAADELEIAAPAGVSVSWIARDREEHGVRLITAVLDYLETPAPAEVRVRDLEGEDLVWETPMFSQSGEQLPEPSGELASGARYFWIAGESAVVTTLRRQLVKGLGIDRTSVAFMGYWRRGVAMRG